MKLLRKITFQDIVVIAFIFVISALIGFGAAQVAKHNIVQHSAPVQSVKVFKQVKASDILNTENLHNFIYELPFKFPDVIEKTAMFETGWLKSNICKNCNNLFGMRYTKRMAIANHNGWAVYDNWKDAVIDRYLWDIQFASNLNRQQYLDFLQRVYCNKNIDTNYIQKINSIKIK